MNLRSISTSGTTITLTWSPPCDATGRTDLLYTISYSARDSSSSTVINTHDTTITITRLSPNTMYTFNVRAEIGSDNSNRTTTITVSTDGASEYCILSGVPSQHCLLFAIVPHNVQLVGPALIWEVPDNLPGESLVHYEILSSYTNNTANASLVGISHEARFELPISITEADHPSYIWVSVRAQLHRVSQHYECYCVGSCCDHRW